MAETPFAPSFINIWQITLRVSNYIGLHSQLFLVSQWKTFLSIDGSYKQEKKKISFFCFVVTASFCSTLHYWLYKHPWSERKALFVWFLILFLFCEVVFCCFRWYWYEITKKVVRGQLMERGRHHHPKLLEKLTIEVYLVRKKSWIREFLSPQ